MRFLCQSVCLNQQVRFDALIPFFRHQRNTVVKMRRKHHIRIVIFGSFQTRGYLPHWRLTEEDRVWKDISNGVSILPIVVHEEMVREVLVVDGIPLSWQLGKVV